MNNQPIIDDDDGDDDDDASGRDSAPKESLVMVNG